MMDLLLFWQDMREKNDSYSYFPLSVINKDGDQDPSWHVYMPFIVRVIYANPGAEFGSVLKL